MITCRSLEYLSYYIYLRIHFNKSLPRCVISSSDVNPNGLAVISFANQFKISTIFFNHGVVVPPLPKLNYSLTVLDSKANFDVYNSTSEGEVVLGNGNSVPCINPLVNKRVKVAIYLSTFPDVSGVQELVGSLRRVNLEVVFIRPHPNDLTIKKEDLNFLINVFPEISVENNFKTTRELVVDEIKDHAAVKKILAQFIDVSSFNENTNHWKSSTKIPDLIANYLYAQLVLLNCEPTLI